MVKVQHIKTADEFLALFTVQHIALIFGVACFIGILIYLYDNGTPDVPEDPI